MNCLYVYIYICICLKIVIVNGVCETQCHTMQKCNFNYLLSSMFRILIIFFTELSPFDIYIIYKLIIYCNVIYIFVYIKYMIYVYIIYTSDQMLAKHLSY